MANDTETTLLGSIFSTTTFVATTDGTHFSLQSTPRTNGAEVTTTNRLPVTTDGTVAISGTAAINIGQVAGSSILVGAGTAAGAVRIAFPTDQSLSGTITGTVAISGTPAISGTVAVAGVTGSVALPTGASTAALQGVPYPPGATPITASATGTTGATTATLAANATKSTYICGFSIRANATAAATANSTVTGTVTGTLNFTQWTAPAASGIGITEMIFQPPIISSGTNTAIAVISAAPGSGGVVSVSSWGFQL